ncbi:MAG: prenyltransferase/squalene oxidase repeat-containing protein [Planctomycetota bacterium]|nr:prenyltransferase/squalene oxidase repeat-containing protein [Planctomycetota bacterium]
MNEEHYDDEHDEFDDEPANTGWLTNTPYWLISVVAHGILLFVLGGIVILEVHEEKEERRTVVKKEVKPPKYDPTKKRDIERKPEILEKKKTDPIKLLKPDKITRTPKGEKKNKTNKNIKNQLNDAFGLTGAGAGAYGNRFGKGSLSREGGSEATESAVLAALMWLKRHQHPDGHWSSNGFLRPDGCEKEDGDGFDGYDVGCTALAMLAYLGFGHTHESGEFSEFVVVMRKAMNWMLEQQIKGADPKLNGLFGLPLEDTDEWIYNHSIATMAMSELLLMSHDKIKLSKPVENATKWCLRAQNPGYGWKYGYQAGHNDTSVTGWMVLALKTSKVCAQSRYIKVRKKDFDPAFEGALKWFASCTSPRNGICGYENAGDPGSQLQSHYPEPYPYSKDLSCMTAVGVLCRIFAGEKTSTDAIKQGTAVLMDQIPNWRPQEGKRKSKINLYYWYYATYAMFQIGGSKWREWNEAMIEALVRNQRVGGCEDGSWDPIGEWGIAGGRVYNTAIGAMTLEVYYRFARASN